MATSVHGIGNRGRLLPDILLTGNSLLNEYIDNCASSYYDFWKIITLFTRGSLVYTGEHNDTETLKMSAWGTHPTTTDTKGHPLYSAP